MWANVFEYHQELKQVFNQMHAYASQISDRWSLDTENLTQKVQAIAWEEMQLGSWTGTGRSMSEGLRKECSPKIRRKD